MRNLIITTLLLIVSGIFLLFWDSPSKVFFKKTAENIQQKIPEADGYMLDTRTVQHDKEGLVNYTLETTGIRYFIGGDKFEMDTPHILALDPDHTKRPWLLDAEKGFIVKNGQKITLTGDVHAWQFINATDKNELNSQELIFFPDENKIKSDQKVIITTPQGKTSGVGMQADLRQENYKLLNKVRGIHNASR